MAIGSGMHASLLCTHVYRQPVLLGIVHLYCSQGKYSEALDTWDKQKARGETDLYMYTPLMRLASILKSSQAASALKADMASQNWEMDAKCVVCMCVYVCDVCVYGVGVYMYVVWVYTCVMHVYVCWCVCVCGVGVYVVYMCVMHVYMCMCVGVYVCVCMCMYVCGCCCFRWHTLAPEINPLLPTQVYAALPVSFGSRWMQNRSI